MYPKKENQSNASESKSARTRVNEETHLGMSTKEWIHFIGPVFERVETGASLNRCSLVVSIQPTSKNQVYQHGGNRVDYWEKTH